MATPVEPLLRSNPLYRRLTEEDRKRLAEVSLVRSYPKGTTIFSEGDPSDFLYTVEIGRVKVAKMLPGGKEVILEILGAGDPLGAVAAYESRPYPASAVALEDCTLLLVKRAAFFALLETSIRIMSRWGKAGVVLTEKEGFVLTDRSALERLVAGW